MAAASSILHTASLHPHFLWCSLNCGEEEEEQQQQEALEGAGEGVVGSSGCMSAATPADPLSALFEATGGNWDFMVYGKDL